MYIRYISRNKIIQEISASILTCCFEFGKCKMKDSQKKIMRIKTTLTIKNVYFLINVHNLNMYIIPNVSDNAFFFFFLLKIFCNYFVNNIMK